MTDRVRAGIVGVGFMGTVHARAVRQTGGVVTRIAGSTPESSRAGAERIGAECATESVDELLATFADGLRAARITQAVLDSSRTSSWVEVA